MKLSELIKQLEKHSGEWKDAEVIISVKGKYDYHTIKPCDIHFMSGKQVEIWSEYINKPEEALRGEHWRAKAVQLVVQFPVWKVVLDDLREFKKYVKKAKIDNGDAICKFIVDLKSHKIAEWDSKVGAPGSLFYKVVDRGTYTLIGADGEILKALSGYIPNRLIPPTDGYGDYIELRVAADGTITNWYEEDSFDEFDEVN
jgi:hypothetical protein